MARLMPFRARSAYTRRSTRNPVAATIPSSPPTSLDIPPSSAHSSCTRKSSSSDISSQSSSSKEKYLSPENALALQRITASINDCSDLLRDVVERHANANPPPYSPQIDAVERLVAINPKNVEMNGCRMKM